MIERILSALVLCCLALPAWSQSETGSASPEQQEATPAQVEVVDAAVETIQVPGQRPGPGLWKISKGDHVLWVFGTYSPLPKNMEWRSHEVEAILARSQEVLWSPSTTVKMGFFRKVSLLPHVIGVNKNPDGATLRDLLPADVYARWRVLKEKYLPSDESIERDRPIIVADRLFQRGLFQAGLSSDREVGETIGKIVKKNNIKTTSSIIELVLEDPVKMINDFKKSPMDDVACFSKTLERLETDIDAMRIRANAWAKGDLEAIQKLNYADNAEACTAAILNSSVVKGQPGIQATDVRMREAWLANAEKALANNASTFAVLRLKDILDPKGVVAALQAKGYLVEKPD